MFVGVLFVAVIVRRPVVVVVGAPVFIVVEYWPESRFPMAKARVWFVGVFSLIQPIPKMCKTLPAWSRANDSWWQAGAKRAEASKAQTELSGRPRNVKHPVDVPPPKSSRRVIFTSQGVLTRAAAVAGFWRLGRRCSAWCSRTFPTRFRQWCRVSFGKSSHGHISRPPDCAR
jgi:hypothetical protein